ncbi:MAG: hypothetical protein M3256_00115 [Actinomycetota bacterium]|nr:hypothetical protein [Actinomycetota bacterium]
MRWSYGSGLGAIYGIAQDGLRLPFPLAGLGLGAAVWIFEILALPATGATPPLRRWGRAQIAGDALQTMLFGTAAAATLAVLGQGDR